MQFVPIKLQTLNQLFHALLRLEWQERQAVRDIPPLSQVLAHPEPLAQLLHNTLSLLVLERV